jgi:CHAD domain-containing protein
MSVPLPSYRQFGKQALKKRFSVFLSAIVTVRTRTDAESIHDLRVAARRFHAAALLFKESVSPSVLNECERHVRRIRKSSGAVRDGDVQISSVVSLQKKRLPRRFHPGLHRLALRLSQRREKRIRRIVAALDAFEKSGIVSRMNTTLSVRTMVRSAVRPLPLRQRAAGEITAHLERLLRYEQFVKQPTAAAELHAMRIEAKRLRYVMEIFAPVYGGKLKPFIRTIRSIQDALGEMHDCDVWIETVPLFLEKERMRTAIYFGDATPFVTVERGVIFFLDHIRRLRMTRYRSFASTWTRAIKKSLWKKLLLTIS